MTATFDITPISDINERPIKVEVVGIAQYTDIAEPDYGIAVHWADKTVLLFPTAAVQFAEQLLKAVDDADKLIARRVAADEDGA
jgi:hypothetical protein